ncbi:hypothetical protein Vadar_024519 [Vaccinium darrowii]|uniref:Uncharacterized protein n=1 Tax=Vaccinium darrowii TaxID=229202 RepID=A0ACB7X3J8_9ERIC|nr:hypothetical protein Vadar_024519 [Vaccinium darrowii]
MYETVSADDSETYTANGLLEQINVTRDASNYLWYLTDVNIQPNERFLKNEQYPILAFMSAGHALQVSSTDNYQFFSDGGRLIQVPNKCSCASANIAGVHSLIKGVRRGNRSNYVIATIRGSIRKMAIGRTKAIARTDGATDKQVKNEGGDRSGVFLFVVFQSGQAISEAGADDLGVMLVILWSQILVKGVAWQLRLGLDKITKNGADACLSNEVASALKSSRNELNGIKMLADYQPYMDFGCGPLFHLSTWGIRHPAIPIARIFLQIYFPQYTSWMIAGHGLW